jgi:glycosyltransferase involved in cell wall biosynthesis
MSVVLSVIVPTRNRADLLVRCLLRLKEQTCLTMEVLLLDDGSDAAHRQALQQAWHALDERFRLIEVAPCGSTISSGPSVVRNWGVNEARGNLLAFCDDDDLWTDPDHAARVVHLFSAQPDLDLFIGNQRALHVDGRSSEDWLPALTALCAKLPPLGSEAFVVTPAQLCGSGGFGHMNMITMRKQLIERMGGGFWTRVSYEEDRDFFWRAVDAAKNIAYSPRVMSLHHVPDPSRRANVSTGFSQHERWLVANMVSQHIVATVRHTEIVKLNSAYQGDLLRRLATAALAEGRRSAGARLAWQALACRFSWKWLLASCLYAARALLNR